MPLQSVSSVFTVDNAKGFNSENGALGGGVESAELNDAVAAEIAKDPNALLIISGDLHLGKEEHIFNLEANPSIVEARVKGLIGVLQVKYKDNAETLSSKLKELYSLARHSLGMEKTQSAFGAVFNASWEQEAVVDTEEARLQSSSTLSGLYYDKEYAGHPTSTLKYDRSGTSDVPVVSVVEVGGKFYNAHFDLESEKIALGDEIEGLADKIAEALVKEGPFTAADLIAACNVAERNAEDFGLEADLFEQIKTARLGNIWPAHCFDLVEQFYGDEIANAFKAALAEGQDGVNEAFEKIVEAARVAAASGEEIASVAIRLLDRPDRSKAIVLGKGLNKLKETFSAFSEEGKGGLIEPVVATVLEQTYLKILSVANNSFSDEQPKLSEEEALSRWIEEGGKIEEIFTGVAYNYCVKGNVLDYLNYVVPGLKAMMADKDINRENAKASAESIASKLSRIHEEIFDKTRELPQEGLNHEELAVGTVELRNVAAVKFNFVLKEAATKTIPDGTEKSSTKEYQAAFLGKAGVTLDDERGHAMLAEEALEEYTALKPYVTTRVAEDQLPKTQKDRLNAWQKGERYNSVKITGATKVTNSVDCSGKFNAFKAALEKLGNIEVERRKLSEAYYETCKVVKDTAENGKKKWEKRLKISDKQLVEEKSQGIKDSLQEKGFSPNVVESYVDARKAILENGINLDGAAVEQQVAHDR